MVNNLGPLWCSVRVVDDMPRAGSHYNLGTSRGPDKIGSRAGPGPRAASCTWLLYKITNNIVTVSIHTYLTHWKRPTTRSHNLCYMPYQCNTYTLKYSFFPRTIILWNSLPSHIASAPTPNMFKDAVFTWTNTTTAAAV